MTISNYISKHDAGYSTAQYLPVSGGEARTQSVIEVDETKGEVVGQEAEPERLGRIGQFLTRCRRSHRAESPEDSPGLCGSTGCKTPPPIFPSPV
jgi:hypothetical protein